MASERSKELYRRRKQAVEPVFGIIKEMLGFRRFHLRGLAKVKTESKPDRLLSHGHPAVHTDRLSGDVARLV